MKKILSFVLAAVALVFTACSNDETIETSGNGQNNKGMVLVATVSQQASRATMNVDDTFGTWNFTFNDKDNVVVGNKTITNYYTFTKSGTTFSSTDAKVTTSATDWYAYYPATDIDLTNQEGTSESAAKLYALAGMTEKATTGSTPLQISMEAKTAVLRIVKVDNYGPCDIYLKTADDKYVSGLKAKKNEAGYEVVKSDTKVSVFTKPSDGNAGIYYVIVPAGVKISVYNSDKLIKTTKAPGLTAGQYYTLTSGPTTGTAEATIGGETKPIKWVQLWIGGPRIAEKNVEGKMNWTDAAKPGSAYVWGGNWRTPTKDEMDFVDNDGQTHNKENVDVENTTQDNVSGYLYKGVQPGYTKNNMFLPATNKDGSAVYWSQTLENDKGVILNMHPGEKSPYHYFWTGEKYHEYAVRPILSKKTVLWGEQNIK